jgi:hypothetical protein
MEGMEASTATVEQTGGGIEPDFQKEPGQPKPVQSKQENAAKTGAEKEAKAVKEAAAEEERKLKAKFKGKEVEVTESQVRKYLGLAPEDMFDEKAHISAYQMKRLYEDSMNTVANERRALEAEINAAKTNFAQYLQERAGVDPYEFAYNLLSQQQQLAELDPRERAIYEREQQIAAYEQQIQQQQEQQRQIAYQREVEGIYNKHTQGMARAIERMGFPMDETMLAMAADHIEAQVAKGRKDINYEEAAEWTMNKFKFATKSVVSKLKGDALINFLGDDVVREIRQTLLQKPNGQAKPINHGQISGVKYDNNTKSPASMSRDEYEQYLANRMKALDGKR